MTPKQAELLGFIDTYIQLNGHSPSYDQMAKGVRLASKSNIARIASALARDGYISKGNGAYRSIMVLRRPVAEDKIAWLVARIAKLEAALRNISEFTIDNAAAATAKEALDA